jgi:hypothetical protein
MILGGIFNASSLYQLQQIDPGHIIAVMADQLFPHSAIRVCLFNR